MQRTEHNIFKKFFFLLLLFSGMSLFGQNIQNGQVDLTSYDFNSTTTLSLNGDWKFFPSQFVVPESVEQSAESILIDVPNRWEQSGLSALGFGSYQLVIYKKTDEPLALRIPDLFSAYNLFVNGQHLTTMGVPGVDSESEKPGRQFRLVSLGHIQSDTLNVVIHISNFVHSKGGIGAPIQIGTLENLIQKKFINDVYDVFMAGCLVMGAFIFMGMYFYGRQKKMAFYFALFCLVYAYRIIGWGNYVLHDLIDMPYRLGMTIEYSTLYSTVFFFGLYLKHLFPEEVPKKLVNGFLLLSLFWTLMTLTPVYIFTQLNDPFLIILLLAMIFISVVFISALIRGRQGARYSIYSTMGIIVVFLMKTLAYLNVVEEILWVSMLGQLVFFLFQSLILSKHFTSSWRQAKEEAESAMKVRSDFLSIMSHEIRTPLNTVIGTTYHLLDENPRKEQVEELNNLKNASEYLLTLINNVLDYSKIDAGKLEFDESNTQLKRYSEGVFNVFKPIASQKGIALNLEYDEKLPEVVKLDKARVNQILTNLIGNAIKFTEKGNVTLAISLQERIDKNVKVLFEIKDTGIGVSSDLKDRIFKSFQQANTSITRKYGGTGLGLSITKQLVEMMGSEIHMNSEKGKGSTFYFTLALKIGNKVLEKFQETEAFDLSGFHVLLVEDNHMNVLIAKRLLEKWNMIVDLAENGLIAIDKVENNTYDIVLMDLQMPEMDGYEATRILRKKGFKLPILALTASAMYEKSEKLETTGLDGLVTKPFNPKDLYKAISDRLEKKPILPSDLPEN
ncbi:MAG: ATP-binding protein [Cyclobacteriaceae bacterium]